MAKSIKWEKYDDGLILIVGEPKNKKVHYYAKLEAHDMEQAKAELLKRAGIDAAS